MIKNYITIALRNLLRHKTYSIINILGLAIGMASCVLVLCYVQDEWGYDQFHPHAERMYRVVRETRSQDGTVHIAQGTSGPLASALLDEIPEIEAAARIWQWRSDVEIDQKRFSRNLWLTDPGTFTLFNFPFIQGNPETVFNQPNAIVLSESTAQAFFNRADPIGETITIKERYFSGDYIVTGILQDAPQKSTLQFHMITATVPKTHAAIVWNTWYGLESFRPIQTFFLLREGADLNALTDKLATLMRQKMGDDIAHYNTYHIQPLLRIKLFSHLDYGFGQDIAEEMMLFASIAGFILLIACINFMNLATARSIRRAHEVGVRKAVGAHRTQLIRQFLSEATLTALLAIVLGIGLAELALPAFNYLTQKNLILTSHTYAVLSPYLIGLTLLVGLLAGSYPAFFLSHFQPVHVLKGHAQTSKGGARFRKMLVVFQFGISIFLIVGTLVIYRQTEFMQTKETGFNKEHLIILPIFQRDMSTKPNAEDRLSHKHNWVKDTFLQHPNVLKATAYRYDVGRYAGRLRRVQPEGAVTTEWEIPMNEVDEDFFDTFEIPLVAGRPFSADIPTDQSDAFIVNEAAVKAFGWANPIGKHFDWPAENRAGTIIGVMQDFHTAPMREKIEPMVFIFRKILLYNLGLRVRNENLPETLAFLEKTWKQFLPDYEFTYAFMDDTLYQQYENERRLSHTTLTFAILAIFIATLGLFGLASFTTEQRTREIGLRKVLGASIGGIVQLLSRDFLKWVLIANVLAWPITFWVMNNWLHNFPYRIQLNLSTLILGSLFALGIAILAVCTQAFKAARTNPVDALRYE